MLCRNSNFGENTVMGVFRRDPHSELLMLPQSFCLFVKAVIEGHVYRLVQSWHTVRSAWATVATPYEGGANTVAPTAGLV